MEPFDFLVEVFVDFLVWLNRTSHQPLRDVIPDLTQFYANPAATLREHPVTIGPARPRGTILYATFALTLFSYCAGCAGWSSKDRSRGGSQFSAWFRRHCCPSFPTRSWPA